MHRPKRETLDLQARAISYAVIFDQEGNMIKKDTHIQVGAKKYTRPILSTVEEIEDRLPFRGLIMKQDYLGNITHTTSSLFLTYDEIYKSVHDA